MAKLICWWFGHSWRTDGQYPAAWTVSEWKRHRTCTRCGQERLDTVSADRLMASAND